jgi:hypothetical protein
MDGEGGVKFLAADLAVFKPAEKLRRRGVAFEVHTGRGGSREPVINAGSA